MIEAVVEHRVPTKLLVLDTFARALQGVEENSAREMGIAMASIDRIRTSLGYAVLLIHHTCKNGDGRRRTVQPEGLRHRFGTGGILALGQASQHPPKQPLIQRPRLLERRVGRQRHFEAPVPIAHPQHRETELQIGEIDRARLAAHRTWVGWPSSRAYRGPAKRVISASSSSATACRPNGIKAWIAARRASSAGTTASPTEGFTNRGPFFFRRT
jgi:hypothetical protein